MTGTLIASLVGDEPAIFMKGPSGMAGQYTEGTNVVSMDGYDIGTVERVDDNDLIVRLHDSGEEMRVPVDVIDAATSTTERIVIQGAIGDFEASRPVNPRVTEPGDSQTLPLVAEEAIAHVRGVDRGKLVIDKHVEMVPHEASVDIGTDRVEIERVPVNREVATPPPSRQEGDTLIVPVIEEVLVVTKRYRVVEEIHVRKYRDVETRTFTEELRREVVAIREIDEEGEIVDR
jgi:stress response protein YsnF